MTHSLLDPRHLAAGQTDGLRDAIRRGDAGALRAWADERGGLSVREASLLLRDVVREGHPVAVIPALACCDTVVDEAACTAVSASRPAHLQVLLGLSTAPAATACEALVTAVVMGKPDFVSLLLAAGADARHDDGKALREAARHSVRAQTRPSDQANRAQALVAQLAAHADVGRAFLVAAAESEFGTAQALIPHIPLDEVLAVEDALTRCNSGAAGARFIDELGLELSRRAEIHEARRRLEDELPAAGSERRFRL